MGKALVKVEDTTAIVMGDVLVEPETSADAVRSIVEGILRATTLKDIFAESTTLGTKDLVGVPLAVMDVVFMASELEDNPGNYILIKAVHLDTGEPLVINSGSKSIMAKLHQAKLHKLLPVEVEVIEVGVARKGESAPLGMRAIGKTAAAIESAQS